MVKIMTKKSQLNKEKSQQIYLYNTLTRKKEQFTSIKEGEVSLYTCGAYSL